MTDTTTTERPTAAPAVHAVMIAVMQELGEEGIAKNGHNAHSNYKFRSIDDTLAAFNKACVKHGLTIVPEALERSSEQVGKNRYTTVKMRYTMTAVADGSSVSAVYYGEGADVGDKSVSKAGTNAQKYLLINTFMVPVEGMADGDADTLDRHEAAEEQKREQLAAQRARNQARDRLLATGARKGLDAEGVIAWYAQQSGGNHPKDGGVQDLVMAEAELAKQLPDKAPADEQQSAAQRGGRSEAGSRQRHPAGRRLPQQQQGPGAAPCPHPQGFTWADDHNGHSGSFCHICGEPEPEPGDPPNLPNIPGQRGSTEN